MTIGSSRSLGERGFTLVEILVAIGLIAVLMAILLPAISGARASSHKVEELSNLRQVGAGWSLYSDHANGRILPGYIDPVVQNTLNMSVTLNYDGSTVPPSDAATYVWRLMPYLSHHHFLVHTPRHDEGEDPRPQLSALAQQPAFGYNANYLGGWWERQSQDGRIMMRWDASNVIAYGHNMISRPEETIVFASSGHREAGVSYDEVLDNAPGSHFVTPPTLAQTPQWTATGSTLNALAANSMPIMRFNSQIAVVHADGHTAGEGADGLFDQRRWIPRADRADYTHPE